MMDLVIPTTKGGLNTIPIKLTMMQTKDIPISIPASHSKIPLWTDNLFDVV